MTRPRKIPLRMCVGCRERKNKRDLIRIVRTPDGTVLVDATGKKSGRGAYICPNKDCLDRVIISKGLERALEVKIDQKIVGELQEQLATISINEN